ncbi:MAG: 3'-5' exonuclease [Candidatus Nezhaarchaeota archaeon]|nr:3'-5' exonuclease [Candidatus Nezhaarchaeota archaeon]
MLLRRRGRVLEEPVDEALFVSIDLETSGLDPKRNSILSIGAATISRGEVRLDKSFYSYVRPEGSFDEECPPVHGITLGDLLKEPSFKEIAPRLLKVVDEAVLVGYNASFDVSFLNEALRRHGLPRLKNPLLDVLPLSYGVLSRARMDHTLLKMDQLALSGRMSLGALAELLSVPVINRHTAIGDALTVALIFLKLLPLAKSVGVKKAFELLELAKLGESHVKRISILGAFIGSF